MIEVSCPSSRMNNHKYMYERWPKSSLIKLAIEENGVKFEMELTVAEAEELAANLTEWIRDIKGNEEESA